MKSVEKQIMEAFAKIRLEFYRKVFTRVRERDGSLSAMEVFSLEVIYALNRPTISQFARFIGISQSNATYKVNSLTRKGYLVRCPSEEDGREYNLELSDKFYSYTNMLEGDLGRMIDKMFSELNKEELAVVAKAVGIIARELDSISEK
ncbi:MAG: MarR family transcriptional regulator [Clostridia bacterium]|nr:MarR family transcriptional regulator [Clostridia bacterium]